MFSVFSLNDKDDLQLMIARPETGKLPFLIIFDEQEYKKKFTEMIYDFIAAAKEHFKEI